jgi:DNA-binding response OmpR family regulator
MRQIAIGIVEADQQFARHLAAVLGEHGFAAEVISNSEHLLDRLDSRPPDMVVLSEHTNVAAALQRLRRIRAVSDVPCIVMVGTSDDVSEIVVLEAGADDLVARDAPIRTLLARIRAVLRRAEWGPAAGARRGDIDGWRLVAQRRQLLRPDGSECPLTTAEFDLMRLLIEAGGRAVPREDIALGVFRRPFRAEDRTVDNLVLRLRRKLGPGQQNAVKTVRTAGYMFAGFEEDGRRVA